MYDPHDDITALGRAIMTENICETFTRIARVAAGTEYIPYDWLLSLLENNAQSWAPARTALLVAVAFQQGRLLEAETRRPNLMAQAREVTNVLRNGYPRGWEWLERYYRDQVALHSHLRDQTQRRRLIIRAPVARIPLLVRSR